jgi:hypothetical protein
MTEKQWFIEACFTDDLQGLYKRYISEVRGAEQFFNGTLIRELTHKYWLPGNICKYSGEKLTKDNIDIAIGYWTPFSWRPVLKRYKEIYLKNEYFACQCIDCSCNDCISLDRAKKLCTKYNKTVSIKPNTCQPQNINCFIHRKT